MSEVAQVFIEEIEPGMKASLSRTFGEEDVEAFAHITSDVNPAHLDEEFARTTVFGRRVVHGMLTASLISAVLGTRLPGKGAVYVSQSLQFRAPVFLGDTVTAEVEVSSVDARRRRVTLVTRCLVNGKVVLKGEAVVLAPARNG